jgi:hypothetical protein
MQVLRSSVETISSLTAQKDDHIWWLLVAPQTMNTSAQSGFEDSASARISVLWDCDFVGNVATDHEIGNPWNPHQTHHLIPNEQ